MGNNWRHREAKLKARKRQMPKHGKFIGEVYSNSATKKVRKNGRERESIRSVL